MNADPDFLARTRGLSLATAEILYYMPDHPALLQSFVWQTLNRFLEFWKREIEAVIHSVSVASNGALAPARWSRVDGLFRLN
jgi:uncharacterized protein Usg